MWVGFLQSVFTPAIVGAGVLMKVKVERWMSALLCFFCRVCVCVSERESV